MTKDNELSSEASRLLDLARDVPALGSDRRERMKRAALAGFLPDPAGQSRGAPDAPIAGSMASTLRLPILTAVVVSAFVVAVVGPWALSGGSGGAASSAPGVVPTTLLVHSPPPIAATEAPVPSQSPISNASSALADIPTVSSPHALGSVKPAVLERRRSVEPGAVATRPTNAREIPSSAPSPPPAHVASTPVEATASSLHEEVRLVRGADAAVSGRDPNRALELLGEHERRFPRGVLSSERAMLVVLALCAAGRNAEALEHAARFKERYPHSPLQDRLAHSCAAGGRP